MNKHRKIIITCLIIASVGMLFGAYRDRSARNANFGKIVSNDLEANRAIDHRLNALVTYLAQKTLDAMGINLSLNVNGSHIDNGLNIYIFNFDQLSSSTVGGLSRANFTKFFKNNFIAIPPNTILIDLYFFSSLLVDWYNSTISFLQALTNPEVEIENAKSIVTYLRFGNIDAYYKNTDKDFFLGDLLNITNDGFQECYPYFAFIFSHEIAHLYTVPTHKNNSVTRTFEEDRADLIAMETIVRIIANSGSDQDLYCQQAVEFFDFMTDLVLYKAYEGFRGIRAKDHLIEITHKPVWDQTPPRDDQSFIDIFLDPDRVQVARLIQPPIMTKDEFLSIMKRVAENGSSANHQHIFSRSHLVLERVGSFKNLDYTKKLHPHSYMFSRYSAGEYRVTPIKSSSIGLTVAEITSGISNIVRVESVGIKGTVLFPTDMKGYVQVLGDPNRVETIQFTLKAEGKDILNDNLFSFLSPFIENIVKSNHGDGLLHGLLATANQYRNFYPRIDFIDSGLLFSVRYLNTSDFFTISISSANGQTNPHLD
jgi:hypothetical protein